MDAGKITQLPPIPDDMSIAQFMLYCQHEARPPIDDELPCLVDSKTGRTFNISQLRHYTFGLANALSSDYDIGSNDRVMILSPNSIDYPLVLWSIHRLGGIVTCSNPQFTTEELCHQLRTANVTFMIVHSTVLDVSLRAARVCGLSTERIILMDKPGYGAGNAHKSTPRSPRGMVPDLITKGLSIPRCFSEQTFQRGEGKVRVALLAWSSGTTGTPKAVAMSHYGLIANVIQMSAHTQNSRGSHFSPSDTAIGVLPFFHVAGLVITVHFILFRSMRLVVTPKYELLDMLDTIVRHKVSHLLLVPPQAVALAKYRHLHDYDLKILKYIGTGAAPLSPDVQKELLATFPTLFIGQVYGMTELTVAAAMLSGDQQHGPLGSGGRLLPGVAFRVVRPDGTPSKPDEPGELFIKSPAAALGYWGNASATKETFIDGWVRSGDQVIVTPDREVHVLDRIKEFIKVRGFQVAPAELEGSLLGHPDIVDCCVVGVEDERSGELPLAFVVLSADARKRSLECPQAASNIRKSIQHYIAEKKVRYKHLDGGVQFLEALPRNGSGKLLRRSLRQRALEGKKPISEQHPSKL